MRNLCITRSKISKRNIVSHECLSGKLGAEALYTLLQPIIYDYWDKALFLGFKFDSTCTLAMLNPAIELKSMLLSNAVESFKEEVKKISIQFPNSTVTIGHLPGPANPADSITKLYRDPIEVINSEDTVATCKNGSFKFLGLPDKFLAEPPSITDDSCNNCGESINLCALIRTRSQVKRENKEDLEARKIEDEIHEEPDGDESAGKKGLKMWLEKAKVSLEVGQGNNLIDHQYAPNSKLIMEKKHYLHWLSQSKHISE